MTDLVIRKIPWEFDADVPFLLAARKPGTSESSATLSHSSRVPEKAIIACCAPDRPQDRLRTEAFRGRKQHAAAHRSVTLALIMVARSSEECYQETGLLRPAVGRQPVEYITGVRREPEATFTPLFKVFLDNRQSMFDGGEPRVPR